eukprot:6166229-Lingulodinium_polyedra.AAC.1
MPNTHERYRACLRAHMLTPACPRAHATPRSVPVWRESSSCGGAVRPHPGGEGRTPKGISAAVSATVVSCSALAHTLWPALAAWLRRRS